MELLEIYKLQSFAQRKTILEKYLEITVKTVYNPPIPGAGRGLSWCDSVA